MTRREELDKLMRILDTCEPCSDEWDVAYERYCELQAIEQEEYRNANIGKLKEYYDEHIAGKTWAEIDGDRWDWYSDWHKDVFGYRPRSLAFGE